MKKVLFFFIALLGVVFFACQKDMVTAIQTPAAKSNFMTVAKAKAWFDETEPKTVWTKTEKQEHYKPQWNLAVQLNGAVEVPVLLEDKTVKPSINPNNPKLYGVTRLLVASLDGYTIDAAIIKYLPTDKFVGNIDEINRDNFGEKKFNGMIKLENFDFTEQKIVLIENGVLTQFMGKNIQYNPNREDYQVCYQSCYTWYGTTSVGDQSYSYTQTTCSGYYCVMVPTGSTGSTDPNQNSGGTTSGGINNSGAGLLNTGSAITAQNPPCSRSFAFNSVPAANGGGAKNQGALRNVQLSFNLPNPSGLTPAPTYPVTIDFLFYSVSNTGFTYATNIGSTPSIEMRRSFMTAWQNTQAALMTSTITATNATVQNYFQAQMRIEIARNFGNNPVDAYATITSADPNNSPTTNVNGVPIPVTNPITNTANANGILPAPCP